MTEVARHIAWAASAASLLEASAEKPGNVTPRRNFHDMSYTDFLLSAVALGPVLGEAGSLPVGELILQGVQATRTVTPSNTNLGIVLLMAPLARAYALTRPTDTAQLRAATERLLNALTLADARAAYQAIRLANPGGLGKAAEQDVAGEPTVTLLEAMVGAAGRDAVAEQYATGYALLFDLGTPAFLAFLAEGLPAREAVVQTFLTILAARADTLIARKLGPAEAEGVTAMAARVLALGGLRTPEGRRAVRRLDRYLRGESNRRNPGTTADLTAAALFVALLLHGPQMLRGRGS